MKPKVFCCLFVFLFPFQVLTQEIEAALERSLKFDNSDETRRKMEKFIAEYKGTAAALFLEAVLEKEAQPAVDKYIQLFTKFPQSKQAAESMFRVAQYYFSRGLYIAARKYFQGLIEKYPDSHVLDDSKYLAAACLIASRKFDSAQSELQAFISEHPASPYSEFAKEELKELGTNGRFVPVKLKDQESEGHYVLQIGAFSKINNALNLRSQFSKVGLPVVIKEKKQGNTTIYSVTLGSFSTKSEAEIFGRQFKREYGQPYRIIPKQ